MDEATGLAREAIRDVLARCSIAGDRVRADDYCAQLTEDATLESYGVDRSLSFRHEGRAAIRAWLTAWDGPARDGGEAERARPAPAFARHHLATSQIDFVDADHAEVRTYWTVYTQIGPDHGGFYLDRLRRVADGRWLIAARSVRVDWHAEGGLFRP